MLNLNSPNGYEVNPRSIADIRQLAKKFRSWFGISKPYVDIVKVLDILAAAEIIDLEVVDDGSLKDKELGNTKLERTETELIPKITIEQRVYDGADEGDGFHRFTIAHEIGHAFLHTAELRFSRNDKNKKNHKWYCDSEWQANTFAAELLADKRYIVKDDDVFKLSEKFGISHSASQYRLDKLKTRGELR